MTDKTNTNIRDELTKEIECGQSAYPTAVLTIDYDLIVQARDRIEELETKLTVMNKMIETAEDDGIKLELTCQHRECMQYWAVFRTQLQEVIREIAQKNKQQYIIAEKDGEPYVIHDGLTAQIAQEKGYSNISLYTDHPPPPFQCLEARFGTNNQYVLTIKKKKKIN